MNAYLVSEGLLSSLDVRDVWVKYTINQKWVGTGVVPTIDPSIQCTYNTLPPFSEGMFYVVIEQPDGSQLVDSVLVED